MRILFLHPQDPPFDGPWARESWDLVVDFGWAGSSTYAEWTKIFQCPTYSFFNLAEELKDVQRIAESLKAGRGRLVDSEGIDWWELIAPVRYYEWHQQLLLDNLTKRIPSDAEIYASRPHHLATTLAKLHSTIIVSYQPELSPDISRYIKQPRWPHLQNILGIALDKWDADFGLRRFAAPRATGPSTQRVLLPSSYVNVSRILCSYARALPDRQFLLVTTRNSGTSVSRPSNVEMRSLASYSPVPRSSATEREISLLQEKWQRLRNELLTIESCRAVIQRGSYNEFPRWLQNGLRVRDAWRRVFERELIDAVLCGDENNYVNRMPVALAKKRKLPTVSCSHGALDMNLMLHGVTADAYLARGEMEKDYLRRCGVDLGRIAVGVPQTAAGNEEIQGYERDQVVLFSEQYELYSGRVDVFYGEVLPQLAAVARSRQKRVIVKLHPFENLAERARLVERILPSEFRDLVKLTNEPLTNSFLDRTWFALTVESSVAVECALRAVPCFLCGWYELGWYGYGRQYEKYGAAKMLRTPAEILEIPDILAKATSRAGVPQGLVTALEPGSLDALLRGKPDRQPLSVGYGLDREKIG